MRGVDLRDSRIPKGPNELTLGELRSRIDVDARMAMTYHTRLALAASPVVLSAWAFLLIGRLPARGRWLLGIVAIASCVAYWSLVSAGRMAVMRETLPPVAGAWLANAASSRRSSF
jgi:lipopolysaccharide export LptBFGC system permease protein LptF